MAGRDEELAPQLERLAERSRELGETAAKLPRGDLPALFRALRAASPEEQRAGLRLLAERLGDRPLVAPTLALARDLNLGGELQGALREAGQARRADCALRQAAALAEAAPDGAWLFAAFGLLLAEDGPDPTELALALGPAAFNALLEELLRLRLRAPAAQRDRTSVRLAAGALRALSQVAPDRGPVQEAASRVLAVEARRAGKGEPHLALAALEALEQVPALPRLLLVHPLLERISRRKVKTRAEALVAAAVAELEANPEELSELVARRGGAEADGWVPVDLEEGGVTRVRIGLAGATERDGPAPCPADERAIRSAERELRAAWEEHARRLERAMIARRSWALPLWRAIFRGEHPLWRDLSERLVWELEGESGGCFLLGGEGPEDLFGDPLELPEDARVGLAHPVLVDPEELELWRERALSRERAAPFPQLFRAVARPGEEPFARLVGREAYKDEGLEWLARARGWSGVPLLGSSPWELERDFGDGLTLRLEVEEIQIAFKATLAQRRKAHRQARGGEEPVIRGHREAKPRVKLAVVVLEGGEDLPAARRAVALAEGVRDLEELSDGLATPDELALRAWQKDKWRAPQESWREIVLAYRRGSPAALELRRALLTGHAVREGLRVRLEDRFAITGQWVIELGTGRCHQGSPKDHLPGWKAAELAAAGNADRDPPRFPFVPEADPETVRVVGLALGLMRAAASPEA